MIYRNFMLDLETLGTDNDAAILSIGVVEFTLPKWTGEFFEEGKIGREFYINVDAQTCIDLGMTVTAKTIFWWMQQSQEARDALLVNQYSIQDALEKLRGFLTPVPHTEADVMMWAHGDVFDMAIMNNAYRFVKRPPPWKYNGVRDARTAYDLTGVWPNASHEVGLTAHNAKDDAIRQTRAVIEGVRNLEIMRYENYLLNFSKSGREQPDEALRIVAEAPNALLEAIPFEELPANRVGEFGLFGGDGAPPMSHLDWVPPENESDPTPDPEGFGTGRKPNEVHDTIAALVGEHGRITDFTKVG